MLAKQAPAPGRPASPDHPGPPAIAPGPGWSPSPMSMQQQGWPPMLDIRRAGQAFRRVRSAAAPEPGRPASPGHQGPPAVAPGPGWSPSPASLPAHKPLISSGLRSHPTEDKGQTSIAGKHTQQLHPRSQLGPSVRLSGLRLTSTTSSQPWCHTLAAWQGPQT